MNRKRLLLLVAGAISRVFEIVGFPLGVVADGIRGVFLSIGLTFIRVANGSRGVIGGIDSIGVVADRIRRFFPGISLAFGVIADSIRRVFLSIGRILECIFASVLLRGITGNSSKAKKGGPKKGNNGFHLYSLFFLIRFVRRRFFIAMSVPRRFLGEKRRGSHLNSALCLPLPATSSILHDH